jgi:hypothetical protein
MAIKLPERNYFTFPELMSRWQCEERDFFHLFIENKLVPSYFFSGEFKVHDYVEEREHSKNHWFDGVPMVPKRFLAHESFMYLLWPSQTSVHDLSFYVFASSRTGESYESLRSSGDLMICPPTSLDSIVYSFRDIMRDGVVMMSEVALFEESAGKPERLPIYDKPLSTTERNTLLKLVIGMAVKGYRYDPAATKSTAPKEIADDLVELGITVTDDTVRKYLKEAASTVLPAKPRQS